MTRVNPDRNIFLINVGLTSTFFTLQRFGPSPSPNFRIVFKNRCDLIYKKHTHDIYIRMLCYMNEGKKQCFNNFKKNVEVEIF